MRRSRATVTVGYRDGAHEATCSLVAAAAMGFEDHPPVAVPHPSRHQRSNAGLYYAASLRAHVQFPSWFARDEAMALDYDIDVLSFAASPFWLNWSRPVEGWHVPTFFVRRIDGSTEVVDCGQWPRTTPPTEAETTQLRELYTSIGWSYRVVDDHDRTWMTNLQWLAGYRHPRFDVPVTASRLLQRFATPSALMPTVHELGNPVTVLPVLYHLLWRQRLSADLTRVLDGSTTVSVGGSR